MAKPVLDFTISAEKKAEARTVVDHAFLSETLFVIPANDGEALRAIDILRAAGAEHLHVSDQEWGATLNLEGLSLDSIRSRGVKRVLIFEMPSLSAEQDLRDAGLEVAIIDHHVYDTVDRSHSLSSLEQLMDLIKWPADRIDMAIAVNDRSYIAGLKQLGLSVDEISEIRKFDTMAQGRTEKQVDELVRSSRELIPRLQVRDGITIIRERPADEGILKQELAIRSNSGIAHTLLMLRGNIGFSGDPKVVKALLAYDFTRFGYPEGSFARYGGGDPNAAMYFRFRPGAPPLGSDQIMPDRVMRAIEDLVFSAREGLL